MNELFATIYENCWSFPQDFELAMYTQGLYQTIGLLIVIAALLGNLAYYYLIDHPRYQRWFHWAPLTLVVDLFVALIAWYIVKDSLDSINLFFIGEYYSLFFFNLLLFFVISFVWTWIVRWRSKSCYKTPIPL